MKISGKIIRPQQQVRIT